MNKIIVRHTDWSSQWEAIEVGPHRTCLKVAYGRNPVQALKRLNSKECERWFSRHRNMRKVSTHMTNGCWRGATGPQWEWDKIFEIYYGQYKNYPFN